jgi:peroxiredoxin
MDNHKTVSRATQRVWFLKSAVLVTIWLAATFLAANVFTEDEPGKDVRLAGQLIGTKAKDWQVKDWLNANPVQLKDLSGEVVLVRWWTEGCPFCSATAPSLNEFYDQFHSRGLEVIGFYHHKSDQPLDPERVRRYAKQLGFKFPVAIDYDWNTLRSWWLDKSSESWTSVSFLIDRKGIIRHVHPGGQYVRGDAAYTALKAKIEQLLGEK